MGDNFFTDEDIAEQSEMLVQQREEREAIEREKNKGFSISCKGCGNEGVKFETSTSTTRATGGYLTETNIYIVCTCGNKERVCEVN